MSNEYTAKEGAQEIAAAITNLLDLGIHNPDGWKSPMREGAQRRLAEAIWKVVQAMKAW
jgi:hypothetical protein